MNHELKCAPEYFDPLARGLKTVELRLNDRDYQVGDMLTLHEYDIARYYAALKTIGPIVTAGDYTREVDRGHAAAYTGRSVQAVITHIVSGGDGLSHNYVALSIRVAVP